GHRMTAARRPPLTTTMRVIDRVHGHATNRGPLAQPALPPRLAELDVGLVGIGDGADRRHAFLANHAHLARGQAQQRVALIAAHQLNIGAPGASELTALFRLQLDIVNDRAHRDRFQGHGIARLHIDPLSGNHLIAHRQALGRNDVGQLAVLIAQQGDESRAIGIVLQALDRRGYVPLAPLEVDQPIGTLVPTADTPCRDPAIVVASARLAQAHGQLLDRLALPELRAIDLYQLARPRSYRIIGLQGHRLDSRGHVDRLTLFQRHHRLLHIRALAGAAP